MSLFTKIIDDINKRGFICPICEDTLMVDVNDEELECPKCGTSCLKELYTEFRLKEEGFYDNEEENPESYEETYEDL